MRGAKVFLVGPEWETTFGGEFLGEDLAVLGKLPDHVADALSKAERPAVILGGAALAKGALGAGLALASRSTFVREGAYGSMRSTSPPRGWAG